MTSHRRMPTAPVAQDRTKPLRCEIDPDVIVAQADGSSVWHIMDDRDMPICRNRPYREFIEHAPFSWLEAQGDRVCRDWMNGQGIPRRLRSGSASGFAGRGCPQTDQEVSR